MILRGEGQGHKKEVNKRSIMFSERGANIKFELIKLSLEIERLTSGIQVKD